ncbi:MAG: ATP-binding protein [Eubacteriaceae bacterium]|jgi:serine/threonine-protein kinase RsbW
MTTLEMSDKLLNGEKVTLELPGMPEFISLARLSVSSIGNVIGFPIDEIEDLKVALSEACTNAMQYGCTEKPSYSVTYTLYPDRLVIDVADSGKGCDFEAIQQPALNGTQVGGFGLYIIRTLMDDLDIVCSEDKGTVLTMTKLLRPQHGIQ